MSFLRQFYQILEGRRLLLGLSVGCGLVFAASNLLPPLLIRTLIQWVTEGGDGEHDLLLLTFLLIAIYLVRGLARYGYGRFSHVAAYQVMHDLMVRVYSHIQTLPHRFFANQRTGNLISRSVNDIEAVEDFVAHGVPETLLAVVIPAAMISVLVGIDAELAAITLLPIPVTGFLVLRFNSRIQNRWRGVRARLSELVAQIQDHISGIGVIKSFVQERHSAARIAEHSSRFRDASIAANSISIIPSGLIEGAGGIGIVLVIWAGGAMALRDELPIADLFLFIVYLAQIYQPFLQLASMNDVLHRAAVSTGRVFELLAVRPDIVDAPGARAPADMAWHVRFDQVSFAYEPGRPVLSDVGLELAEGSSLALVGQTGAGKTTISNLLPRYYDPQKGAVFIGDCDIRQLRLEYLRGHIAAVHQDVFLFHGTVRDNILFGRPDASDTDVGAAAAAAHADEFIRELADGYDTLIGERGVKLSGGQKQRLSIARALLKDAPILVLDEATSAVDTTTEQLIQDAVSRLMQNRTTLVIAHRLSTVRSADQIAVLVDGRVVERGTHDVLRALDGVYNTMITAQALAADA